MRWNALLLLAVACASPFYSANVVALEPATSTQFSEAQINRYGLTRAWMSQVALDANSAKLRHISLFVDRTRSYTVHEISYDNRKEYISERDIDGRGELLGAEGAKKKLEFRLLFLKGKNAVVTEKVLPETMLICVSSRGMVHAIDAETGRTRWTQLVGNARFETLAPAVTETEIGVVSGSNLYILRTEDGLPLKTIPLKHVAAAGPAIADGWAYIPRIDGTMDWYPIREQTKLPSWFRGFGRLETQPSVQPGYVSWITEKGYLYALNSFTQKVQFEIKLVGKPVGSPVYAGDYKIIAATQAGYVVCIDLRTSTVLWRYSTGEPMLNQPLVMGEYVYVTNTTGLMTKLNLSTGVNIETGDVAWTQTGVQKLLAAANGRIYAIGSLGTLLSIDPESGSIVDRIPLQRENAINVFNPITNRLIMANQAGLIESLRATSQVFPEFFPGALEIARNGEETVKKKPAKEEAGSAPAATAPEASGTAEDPFSPPPAGGEKSDPFAP
jgi:outer membrane protein assembly factor BamB